MDNTFLTISEAANLEGKNESTIKRHIKDGKLDAIASSGSRGGRSGITYRIPLTALPVEAQVRYWMAAGAGESGQAGDADLAGYRERYGEQGLRELLTMQAAVQELAGRREGGSKPGEAYAAVAERHGISTRTLRRWEADYRAKGLKGLMRPLTRADAGESRTICAWAGDYIKYLMAGNQQGRMDGGNSKMRQNGVLERLREEAERQGDEACDNCPYCEGSWRRAEMGKEERKRFPACEHAEGRMLVPDNRHAINRYMKNVPRQLLDYGRYGGRYWEAHYMQKVRRDRPRRVNECWFGDHHEFDLFVIGEDGVLIRPWLTAWTDACSGEIVGWMLTSAPNSDTIAESFCRAAAHTVGSDIHGLPAAIYVDNGKDYRSERFEGGRSVERGLGKLNGRFDPDGDNAAEQSLLEYFDIVMIRAQPYRAWSKTIERVFGTLEMKWIRELPGWCGDNPKDRPQDFGAQLRMQAERGELLTFETFAKIWQGKILPAYRAYKGEDGKGESAGEIYKSAERFPTHTPSWDTLALMKSMRERRKVETTGIRFQNARYWDAALADYIGQYVEIRYNRGYNASITVMAGGRYVCEANIAQNMQLIETDREKLIAHMKAQAGQRKKVTSELARLGQSMKGINVRAAYAEEIDAQRDAREATYVSLDAQRAAAGKAEAEDRRAGRRRRSEAGAEKVVNMFEEMGRAMMDRAQEE